MGECGGITKNNSNVRQTKRESATSNDCLINRENPMPLPILR